MDYSIIVFVILILVVSVLLVLNTRMLYRNYSNTVGKNMINSQRERIEKELYKLNGILTDDEDQFSDANHLVLKIPWGEANAESVGNIPNLDYFNTLGIKFEEIEKCTRTAFVLMPFNNSFRSVYEKIKSACAECGVDCSRSDDNFEPGNLLRQIVISIIRSEYIFAVVDGRNPNVFYEIGLAHSIGKRVYLIAHYSGRNQLPFDINSNRVILYKNQTDLFQKIKLILDGK